MQILRPIILLCTFSCFYLTIKAQDVHFSQFNFSPANLNPALTGIFSGDLRFVGNYRNQWQNVPVAYNTFSGAIDYKFYNKHTERQPFAVGLLLNNDQAGDSQLSLTQLALNLAFIKQVGQRHFLSVGGQMGMLQRSFDVADLQFGNQYNGESYDPARNNFENYTNTRNTTVDLSVGANWHYQIPDKRTALDIGLGISHLNKPNNSFWSDVENHDGLPIRYNFYGLSTFRLANRVDGLVHLMHQRQNPHQETLVGLGGRLYLNQKPDQELAVLLGALFRLDDAYLIPQFGVRYRMWQLNFSYDVNTSNFNQATNSLGGPEVSLIYVLQTLKPTTGKICPIYL